jgi:hypothetical protein
MHIIAAHYLDKEAGQGEMVLLMSHAISLDDPMQVVDILKLFREKISFLQDFLRTTEAFTGLSLLLQSPNDKAPPGHAAAVRVLPKWNDATGDLLRRMAAERGRDGSGLRCSWKDFPNANTDSK